LTADVQGPRVYLHAGAGDAFRIAAHLPFEQVRNLLAADPLGAAWLIGNEGKPDFQTEARWFLFDVITARPALLRDAGEVLGQAEAQGQLL
jgi:hypothetical protein